MQAPSCLTGLLLSSIVMLSSPDVDRVSCEVRLAGGQDTVPNAGRVEIWDRNSSEWLAVCGDGDWDFDNGQVVCRELGYPGTAQVTMGACFGDGALNRSVSGFQCYGSEITLERCTHSDNVMDAPCDRGQTAEVICKAPGYIGCFRDRPRGDSIFTNKETIEDLTTETCLQLSRSQGSQAPYIYAGTQNGNGCLYGLKNRDFWNSGEQDSDCDVVCDGNSNQICGGANSGPMERLSIYDANLGYCDDPGTVSNGSRNIRHSADDFYFGTIVEFSCDPGFELHGGPSIQCTMGFKRHGVEWSNDIPDCFAVITPPPSERTKTQEQTAAVMTMPSTPPPSERTKTEGQTADTGACAGLGAAVAFGILLFAALVGIGYWKMRTNSKHPEARNGHEGKMELAKLSPLKDITGDDKTAVESTQDEEKNKTKDSGWVDNKVYESADDPSCPEYVEITL